MSLRNEMPGPTSITTLIDLNTVADTFIPVGMNRCIVRRVTLFDASKDISGGSAQVALYTAAAAGGTAIVAAAVVTQLSATTKFNDRTVATSADYVKPTAAPTGQQGAGFYFRVTVANGTAATCSVALELESLD